MCAVKKCMSAFNHNMSTIKHNTSAVKHNTSAATAALKQLPPMPPFTP